MFLSGPLRRGWRGWRGRIGNWRAGRPGGFDDERRIARVGRRSVDARVGGRGAADVACALRPGGLRPHLGLRASRVLGGDDGTSASRVENRNDRRRAVRGGGRSGDARHGARDGRRRVRASPRREWRSYDERSDARFARAAVVAAVPPDLWLDLRRPPSAYVAGLPASLRCSPHRPHVRRRHRSPVQPTTSYADTLPAASPPPARSTSSRVEG